MSTGKKKEQLQWEEEKNKGICVIFESFPLTKNWSEYYWTEISQVWKFSKTWVMGVRENSPACTELAQGCSVVATYPNRKTFITPGPLCVCCSFVPSSTRLYVPPRGFLGAAHHAFVYLNLSACFVLFLNVFAVPTSFCSLLS